MHTLEVKLFRQDEEIGLRAVRWSARETQLWWEKPVSRTPAPRVLTGLMDTALPFRAA